MATDAEPVPAADPDPTGPTLRLWTITSFKVLVICAGLWWVISDGEVSSWIIGVPAVLVATWAAWRFGSRTSIRLSARGLPRLVAFFLVGSIRGGVDVARRVLSPRLPLKPGFIQYQMRLDGNPARVFFVDCTNLLPGTLAADLRGDQVEVHVLSLDQDHVRELEKLEAVVASLFSQTLG